MSSAPSYSHLLAPSAQLGKRTHRHRRSGAISGNFDVVGLGLFSPPPPISHGEARHSSHSSSPVQISSPSAGGHHQQLLLSLLMFGSNPDSDVLDRHFNFCNEEDFTNKTSGTEFEFPQKGPQSPALPLLSPAINSPLRRLSGGSAMLNSPIRLRNRKSVSSMNTPKLFLTEETTVDEDNVPDALIDLDEILNPSNMLLNDGPESMVSAEPRSFHDFTEDSAFFLQSRFLTLPPVQSCSPFSSPAYFKQPIREPTDRAIEEEDDIEETVLELPRAANSDLLTNAPPTSSSAELYQLSVNSSNTSLPSIEAVTQRNVSATLLEKSTSNSSRDSAFSGLAFVRSNSLKRSSGAKASRYQTFYDQSIKISYALKNLSSENVQSPAATNATPSTAYDHGLHSPTSVNVPNLRSSSVESLGHSSSMPCLRVSGPAGVGSTARNGAANMLALSGYDIRARDIVKPLYPTNSSVHASQPRVQDQLRYTSYAASLEAPRAFLKPIMASEISSVSVGGQNVSIGTHVVGHKYPHSGHAELHKKKSLPLNCLDKVRLNEHSHPEKGSLNDNSQSPSSLYSDNGSTVSVPGDHGTDQSSFASQPEILDTEPKKGPGFSRSVTPTIVVESVSTSSYPRLKTQQSLVLPASSLSNDKSPTKQSVTPILTPKGAPPRAMSPKQEKILQATQIPPFSPSKQKQKTMDGITKTAVRHKSLRSSKEPKEHKEHKRTGSGHRLLSNWFKKCA